MPSSAASDVYKRQLLETTTAVSELELPFVIFDTDPLS